MMRISQYFLLLIFFSTVGIAHGQSQSQFNMIMNAGIGFGIVESDTEPNYNLNNKSNEILINYKITGKFGIATGVGLTALSGNGFNSFGNFYHERTMLKIPVIATMDYYSIDRFRMIANLGVYSQYIINDKYSFLNNSEKNVYEGWNFGVQLGLGFVYEFFNKLSAGIIYTGQSDFTKFSTKENQFIVDKQRLKNLSTLRIVILIDL